MNQSPRGSNLAVVALGSNLGDSPRLIRAAMEKLRDLSTGPLLASALHTTEPVECPPGSPLFVNAVVAFHPLPGETPETLLSKLQDLEKQFGRKAKAVLNEPRPLDLDLIAFGDERRHTAALTLPHPRATERLFVLEPLAEIAPHLLLPGQTKSVRELSAEIARPR